MAEPTPPPELIHCGLVVLRRSRPADAHRVAEAVSQSLAHLRPFMPWASPDAARADMQAGRLHTVDEAWLAGTGFEYSIFDPDDEPDTAPVLGGIGLHRRIGPGGIEMGYWVHVGHTRRGYVGAAAKALTGTGLALPDVDRVEIHCDQANTASAAIPRKLGYRLDRLDDREPMAPAETGRHQIWIYP